MKVLAIEFDTLAEVITFLNKIVLTRCGICYKTLFWYKKVIILLKLLQPCLQLFFANSDGLAGLHLGSDQRGEAIALKSLYWKFLYLVSDCFCYFRTTRCSRKFLNLDSCGLLLGHSQRSEVRCHSKKFLSMVHSEVVENKHATPRKFLHFRLSWIASGVFSGT